MKRLSTLFLRAVIIVIGIATIIACIFILPNAARVITEIGEERVPELLKLRYLFLIGFYISVLPIFFALFQSFKLFNYIDSNNVFTETFLKTLDYIKYNSIIISFLFITCGMPIAYYIAQMDDAPGVILIFFAFFCIPLAIAAVLNVFKNILQDAILNIENIYQPRSQIRP